MKKIRTTKVKQQQQTDQIDKSILLYTNHIDKFAKEFGDEGTIAAINVIMQCSTKGEFAYDKLFYEWIVMTEKKKEGKKTSLS